MPFTYTYGTLKGEWKNDYYNQLVKDLQDTLGTIEGTSTWFAPVGAAIKFNRGTWPGEHLWPGAGQDIHSYGGQLHNFKWVSGYDQTFDAKRTVHMATGYGMVGNGLESSAEANMTAMQTALSTISTYGGDTGAILFFPPGVYIFKTNSFTPIINVPSDIPNLTIAGCGPATKIKMIDGSFHNYMINVDN